VTHLSLHRPTDKAFWELIPVSQHSTPPNTIQTLLDSNITRA
jgi:hypothetical protein